MSSRSPKGLFLDGFLIKEIIATEVIYAFIMSPGYIRLGKDRGYTNNPQPNKLIIWDYVIACLTKNTYPMQLVASFFFIFEE